jgi:uncharacterized protein YndB with AHSA1/START domain
VSPTGQVADGTWELGVTRTCSLNVNDAWSAVVANEGQAIWLGTHVEIAKGTSFELDDGTTGEFTVVKPRSHLRLSWHRPKWPNHARLQLRIMPTASGSSIAFHMERLPSGAQRRHYLARWTAVVEALVVHANRSRGGEP